MADIKIDIGLVIISVIVIFLVSWIFTRNLMAGVIISSLSSIVILIIDNFRD